MSSLSLVCLVFLQLVLGNAQGKDQSVAVTGRVFCHRRPFNGASIFLMDQDLIDPDDQYDSTTTNFTGYFHVEGWENEWSQINPYLRIEHSCMINRGDRPCVRSFTIEIPKEAIQEDRVITKKFKVHDIDLEHKRPDEQGNCY